MGRYKHVKCYVAYRAGSILGYTKQVFFKIIAFEPYLYSTMKIATSGIKIYLALLLILTGCNKQSEIFKSPALKDYYPTAVGKIFIYRMDSTVPASFGSFLVVHSYQAKDSVEAKFLDNAGNESYRIFRTIRDTAGTQPWRFAAIAEIGLGPVRLYGSYSLNRLQKEITRVEQYPYAVGIRFSNW